MQLSHVKKYIRIRHLGCLLVHDIESNTKAKEWDEDLKIQQTATPEVSSLCPQDDTGLTLPPSASRVRAVVGSGYPDAQILLGWEDLLSTLSFNFLPHSVFLFPLAFHSSCLTFQKPLFCPGVRASARSFRLSGMGIYVSVSCVPFPT